MNHYLFFAAVAGVVALTQISSRVVIAEDSGWHTVQPEHKGETVHRESKLLAEIRVLDERAENYLKEGDERNATRFALASIRLSASLYVLSDQRFVAALIRAARIYGYANDFTSAKDLIVRAKDICAKSPCDEAVSDKILLTTVLVGSAAYKTDAEAMGWVGPAINLVSGRQDLFSKYFDLSYEAVTSAAIMIHLSLARAGVENKDPVLNLYNLLLSELDKNGKHDDLRYGITLYSKAFALLETHRLAEAETAFRSTIDMFSKRLLEHSTHRSAALHGLSLVLAEQGRWREAMIVIAPLLNESEFWFNAVANSDDTSIAQTKSRQLQLDSYLHITFRAQPESFEPAFLAAQLSAGNRAAKSLSRAAARFAAGTGQIARLARELQDGLSARSIGWKRLDRAYATAVSDAIKMHSDLEENDRAIARKVEEIDAAFPEYRALAWPQPPTSAALQSVLKAGEAVLLFVEADGAGPLSEETFLWVVTKTRVRWVRLQLKPSEVASHVRALRCGLDVTAWINDARRLECEELLNTTYTESDETAKKSLPFDVQRAHALYFGLLGQVDDLIKDKHLLVVPSVSLTQLPLQVLVTAATRTDASYLDAAWLGTRQPISVLPSISSFMTLRTAKVIDAGASPYVGFGNPLLKGDQYSVVAAQKAQSLQACPSKSEIDSARLHETSLGKSGWVRRVARKSAEIYNGPLADVGEQENLQMQQPLPNTAYEVCSVAQQLNVSGDNVYLGARATERAVKELSDAGILQTYRIVQFATHGLVAGDFDALSEPALVLTPPHEQPSEVDDGLLTASEVTNLNLNADWVVLSACNTAAGDSKTAEALSGLARAFFYAGARSLLVSHWAVRTKAAEELTTSAFAAVAADPSVGRAEALRRAMSALVELKDKQKSHPEYWAPFAIVGEGGPTAYAAPN